MKIFSHVVFLFALINDFGSGLPRRQKNRKCPPFIPKNECTSATTTTTTTTSTITTTTTITSTTATTTTTTTTSTTTTTTPPPEMVACQAANDGFHPALTISGKCYRISKEKKNFDDASRICSYHGGKPIEPKTKAINDEIATEAKYVNTYSLYNWIGINDKGTEGKWVYNSDGQEISWSNWDSGQPNDGSSANCAYTYGSSSSPAHGKWFDVPCTTFNFYFICEF